MRPDAAVPGRYVREPGRCSPGLHVLTRADCHPQEPREGGAAGARGNDGIEQRNRRVSEQEELASSGRSCSTATRSCRVLGVPPGPVVGRAYDFLLDLRIARASVGWAQVIQELLRCWAVAEGVIRPLRTRTGLIPPAGQPVAGRDDSEAAATRPMRAWEWPGPA